MGHSMGGQEVLQFASKGPADIRKQITGYILSAPFIALHPSSVPNRLTVIVGRLAGKVLPKWQLVQKLDPKFLTRDQKVAQGYVDDELVHDTGTLEGLAGMLERAEELDTGKVEVQDGDSVRIWCGHGNGDRVTSHEASKRFMDRCKVKDKEFKTYEGWYHCCKFASRCSFGEHTLTKKQYTPSQGVTRRLLLMILQNGFFSGLNRRMMRLSRRKANYDTSRAEMYTKLRVRHCPLSVPHLSPHTEEPTTDDSITDLGPAYHCPVVFGFAVCLDMVCVLCFCIG